MLSAVNPTMKSNTKEQKLMKLIIEKKGFQLYVDALTWNSGGGSIGANGTTFFKVLKFSALIPPSEQFSNESNWDTSASLSAANWKIA